MSDEEAGHDSLQVILYSFLFFVVGISLRQVSNTYNLKTSYYGLLYIFGMLSGLLSFKVPQMQDAIIKTCGPECLQTLYIPLFFFESAFLLDLNKLKGKMSRTLFLLFLPLWTLEVTIITALGIYIFPYDLSYHQYIALVIFAMTPDVQATKYFFRDRLSFAETEVVSMLEFEALILDTIAVIVYHGLLFPNRYQQSIMRLPFELLTSCSTGLFAGEMASFWVKRIFNDIVIQTTITVAVVFMTYCFNSLMDLHPGLAVVSLGLVMMKEKPSISDKSLNFICKTFELFRFAVIAIVNTIAGMELMNKVLHVVSFRAVSITFIIYIIVFTVRLLFMLIAWSVHQRYFFRGIHEVLLVSACDIRGPFNISFSLMLCSRQVRFPWADDRLFMLASFQIILATFITNPIAHLAFNMFTQRSFDFEKLTMITRCLKVLKSVKSSYIDILKKMAFSADADWQLVAERTQIKRNFPEVYENKDFVTLNLQADDSFIEKRIRRDSIRLLLRAQRHFLKEQFEQGLISTKTAQKLNNVIQQAHKASMMISAESVVKNTSPMQILFDLHQELRLDLNQPEGRYRIIAVCIIMFIDFFINMWGLLSKAFISAKHPSRGQIMPWFYNNATVLVITGFFIKSVIDRNRRIWSSLLLITLSGSIIFSATDLLIYGAEWFGLPIDLRIRGNNLTLTSQHISVLNGTGILIAAVLLLVRVVTLSYCLWIIKKNLAITVSSWLGAATYVQCEALQSFMHILQDSLHHLSSSVQDEYIIQSMKQVLHREHLATRQYLGVLEVISPKVVTSLKTRLASRLIINSQMQMVKALMYDGVLADADLAHLNAAIEQKIRFLNHLSFSMQPPSVKKLMQHEPMMTKANIPWEVIDEIGELRNYKPGTVLFMQGRNPEGLYFILDGLVRAECLTFLDESFTSRLRASHYSPVYNIRTSNIVYMPLNRMELRNFYNKGTYLGERSVLTGKGSHKTARCVTNVKVLLLPTEALLDYVNANKRADQKLSTFEENLWKNMSIRLSARYVQGSIAGDKILTRRRVYHIMECSYIVVAEPGSVVKLEVKHFLAVILVNGSIWDINKEYHYMGPCFIPPRLTHLNMLVGTTDKAIFLIIPDGEHSGIHMDSEWSALRRKTSETEFWEERSDELTPSSGSSDRFPHKRKRDTLFSAEASSQNRTSWN